MKYNFDRHNERRGTDCHNYDAYPADPADVMPLLAADMDFQTLPEVVEALRRVVDRGIYGYAVDCLPGYNEAVLGWYAARQGWNVPEEWLVSCRNVVSATAMLLCANTAPGDAVMTFTPVYSPFLAVIRQNGRRVVECPLLPREERWEIDFELFERQIVRERVKMLLLCSPHNPVGRVWTREELSHIARFCAEHGVFVVSDEIHSDFVFPGHRHLPFLSLPEADLSRCACCTSANKTFNLALLDNANIFIPDEACRKTFQSAQAASYVGGGSYLGKLACATAYRCGAPWVDELVAYLDESLAQAVDFLRRELPELRVTRPEGTYLLWVDCQALGMEPQQLSDFVLQNARLRLVNGAGYGTGGKGYLRVNAARPRAELMEALERMRGAIRL